MQLDLTIKAHGRMSVKELCIYEVGRGKIISEPFRTKPSTVPTHCASPIIPRKSNGTKMNLRRPMPNGTGPRMNLSKLINGFCAF